MRKMIATAAALTLLSVWSTSGEAQARTGGIGIMVGVHGMYTPAFDITEPGEPDALEIDGGFGVSGRLGVAFTPAIAIFGAYDHGWHDTQGVDDVQLRHLFGGVRISLPVLPSLAPYVSGGYGQRRLRGTGVFETDEIGPVQARVDLRGDFFDVGLGTMIYVARNLALDVGGNFSFGDFDTFRLSGVSLDVDSDTINVWRLRAGLTWTPMTDR